MGLAVSVSPQRLGLLEDSLFEADDVSVGDRACNPRFDAAGDWHLLVSERLLLLERRDAVWFLEGHRWAALLLRLILALAGTRQR